MFVFLSQFSACPKNRLINSVKDGLQIFPFDPFPLIDFEAIKCMKKSQKP